MNSLTRQILRLDLLSSVACRSTDYDDEVAELL